MVLLISDLDTLVIENSTTLKARNKWTTCRK